MSADRPVEIGVRHCPQCAGEFRAHVERCPDCRVALTWSRAEPAGEPRQPPIAEEPVEVFATREIGLLPLVRATLEEAGIAYRPIERFVSRAVFGSVERETGFLVPAVDAERARRVLAELPAAEEGDRP